MSHRLWQGVPVSTDDGGVKDWVQCQRFDSILHNSWKG